MRVTPLQLICDFKFLNLDEHKEWQRYLSEWVAHVDRKITIVEEPEFSFNEMYGDFVFIISSSNLSRKILSAYDCVFIRPAERVLGIDTWLFSKLVNPPLSWYRQKSDVSLISSIYSGDEFIDGFLENSSSFERYARCQHFLVRAGSPGNELEKLVAYVEKHPNAILINLEKDPGLYEVWNSAARLSTATYLSNANLDDRRAPDQLTRLVKALEENPKVDVVGAALRVSREKNLRWEDSDLCEIWPKEEVAGRYEGADLFRRKKGVLCSRNLPHCMPIWRRSLQALVGDFDEKLYGPSADWAFWLDSSVNGAGFYFEPEPLGLYLKSESGYWQRHLGEGSQSTFDERIAQEFGWLIAPMSEKKVQSRSLALGLKLVDQRIASGAMLDALSYLLELASSAGEHVSDLLLFYGKRYFGPGFTKSLLNDYCAARTRDRSFALFNALVFLISASVGSSTTLASLRAERNLGFLCADWIECESKQTGEMLFALLARRYDNSLAEKRHLQAAYAQGAKGFWHQIQSVYRLESSINELTALLGADDGGELKALDKPLNLYYYPSVVGNNYLSLLYSGLEDSKSRVHSISRLGQIPHVEFKQGFENIIHVHWINELVKPSVSKEEQESFLNLLSQQRTRGFKLFWTVHNYVSHDCADWKSEIAFRQGLYQLMDKVFVHHPLAVELLDWLPDSSKVSVCEHGLYDVVTIDKSAARQALGLSDEDFLISTIGRVKPYKGLPKLLPTILKALEQHPQLKFALLGKTDDVAVKAWIAANPHDRLIVNDEYIDHEQLETWMSASDVGLLSYENILTSGAMFHWFAAGKPVLAPEKGLLPAYVINGWNGYTYKSEGDLLSLLDHLSTSDNSFIADMTANAEICRSKLQWGRAH